jgi:hypothetical protein
MIRKSAIRDCFNLTARQPPLLGCSVLPVLFTPGFYLCRAL